MISLFNIQGILMTLRIAFYKSKNGNWQDKLIAAGSFSEYSHCEIVFENGVCASSSPRDGGVRFKLIDLDSHWDIFELDSNYSEDAIKYWFRTNIDDEYDWLGAIGSIFHIDLTSEEKKFCSYACAIVLGIDPIISPGGLFRALKKAKLIHVD
jgi:hypothetical protein